VTIWAAGPWARTVAAAGQRAERGDHGRDGVVERYVLPQPDHLPAGQFQGRVGRAVAFYVALQLGVPVALVDRGLGAVLGAGVPEATVHEHRDPAGGEHDVGTDAAAGGQWSTPPAFPSGGGGLVSTLQDYFAFADLLRNRGRHAGGRLLSRASVELMTSDQLTGAQKAGGGLGPGFFEDNGWGFGMSVVTRRTGVVSAGTYGWSGGLGTLWLNDPAEDMIMILMTQQMWSSPAPPAVSADFLTLSYQAIDD